MKTNKTRDTQTFLIQKRLALKLSEQPKPNRKRTEPSALFNAFCLVITALMAGAVAWVILP